MKVNLFFSSKKEVWVTFRVIEIKKSSLIRIANIKTGSEKYHPLKGGSDDKLFVTAKNRYLLDLTTNKKKLFLFGERGFFKRFLASAKNKSISHLSGVYYILIYFYSSKSSGAINFYNKDNEKIENILYRYKKMRLDSTENGKKEVCYERAYLLLLSSRDEVVHKITRNTNLKWTHKGVKKFDVNNPIYILREVEGLEGTPYELKFQHLTIGKKDEIVYRLLT